jgi:Ulp1 family protease
LTNSVRYSDHLDKVFDTARNQKPAQKAAADDIAFLQSKRETREAQNRAKQQETKKVTGGRRIIDRLAAGKEDSRETKSSSRSRRTRSSSDIFEEDEIPATSKAQGIHSSDFYGTGKTTQSNVAASHGTRASTRLSDKDYKPFQTFRERTPSPERWTAVHPNWDKNFWYRSIVHPLQGKNQATVELQDIERLDEGEFLNDSLIGFYLRLLETRLQDDRPELAKRVYFFNTFFYTRLTSSGTKGKGINYAAVERWTSRVKLLDYDYIIVPVNENTHWYVAIICNAPKLLPRNSEDVESSQSQDISAKSEEHKIAVGENKSTRSSPSSAKHLPTTTPEAEVNTQIEGMSLEDKPTAKEETRAPKNKPDDDPKEALNNKMELDDEDSWPETNEDGALKQAPVVGVSERDRRGPPADEAKEVGTAATTITSDISTAATPKTAPIKKGKRKSTPGPRKYSIDEPRIITFDSFDQGHSATCTNLKQYLVAEAKAKLNIDIDPPAQIGMTAKNIPKQHNFCDCGLFLLGYVETFLKKPDEFIHGILQNQVDVELKWPEAPEMRNNIRNIIFKLQKDRMTEPEKLRYENDLAEKAEKEKVLKEKAERARAEKAKAEREKAEREKAEKAKALAEEEALRRSRASSVAKPVSRDASDGAETFPHRTVPEKNQRGSEKFPRSDVDRQQKAKLSKALKPDPDVYTVEDDSPKAPQPTETRDGTISKLIQNTAKGFFSLWPGGKIGSGCKSSLHQPSNSHLGVEEVLQKVDSSSHPRARAFQSDLQDFDIKQSVETRDDDIQNVQGQPPNSNHFEIPDTPEKGEHDQVPPTPVPESRMRDTNRNIVSPSPEAGQHPPSPILGNAEHIANNRVSASTHSRLSIESEFNGFEDEDPIDLINTDPAPKKTLIVIGDSQASEDEEMLLDHADHRGPTAVPSPRLLTSSPASSPTLEASSKKKPFSGRSAPPSPVMRHELRRKPMTSPTRAPKRKFMADSQDDRDSNRHRLRPSPFALDSSDRAVIGRHGQKQALHTYFDI